MEADPIKYTQLFINGKFVNSLQNKTFPTYNPSTGEEITQVSEALAEDVDLAVNAARKAFDHGPWRRFTGSQRAKILHRFAELVLENLDELSYLETLDNGKPEYTAREDITETVKVVTYYAGYCDKIHGETIPLEGPYLAYVRKEPIGVCAQIIPWNYPFIMFLWKVVPALATGCTVVIKPAEMTPLSALFMASLFQKAGLPDGVLNVINGYGPTCGTPLVEHPLVDKVAFTGSTQVGYHIMRNCHKDNLKRVTLELGGKSANIILKDADLDLAVETSLAAACCNAGQSCIAPGRIFVQEEIYEEFVKRAVEEAKQRKVCDPFDEDCEQGPQISEKQMLHVLKCIETGVKEGGKLLFGGKRIGTQGYFIEPTVFADITDEMTIAKEEIFGPVMVILKFKTVDEVIQRANNSKYGLGAGVFSNDIAETMKIVNAMKAGTVYVNCYDVTYSNTPFGGFKDSGIGRELGTYGLDNYLEIKTVIVKIADDALP